MKLSTLLLSSAALVVAGSAYAADLPAKKGAPAKAATGCPAFGAGFFQIPGGDTCIKFSGRVTYDGSYNGQTDLRTEARYSQAGAYRFNVDVRSNTEVGAVRGFLRDDTGSMGYAYIQFAGLTAGAKDSLADIAGTNPVNWGSGWKQKAVGVDYSFAAGSTTVAFGLENAYDNNTGTGLSDNPDPMVSIATAAGPINLKVAAVSHEAVGATSGSQNGYAVLGHIDVKAGAGVTLIGFAGASSAAGAYTGGVKDGVVDTDATAAYATKGTSIGGEVDVAFGAATLALGARQNVHDANGAKTTTNTYVVSVPYTIAKNLSITPEFGWGDKDVSGEKTQTSGAYIRIERDF